MSLYRLLKQREKKGAPVRVGIIGAGTFGTSVIAQIRQIPGMQLVCIAELDQEKARKACLRTGWPGEDLCLADSAAAINDAAQRGKVALTGRSDQLIQAEMDVVTEITGIVEAGAHHAWKALEAGKHVIMVNVETDVLLGPALKKKAEEKGLVYSQAYGDQPAIICEMIDWARTAGFDVVCAGKWTFNSPKFSYSTPETVWENIGFSKERLASGSYNPQMYNSFIDGTKSAIEMCAVANDSALAPQKRGLQFAKVGPDELQDVLIPVEAGGILEHSGTVETLAFEQDDKTPVARAPHGGVYITFRLRTDFVRQFMKNSVKVDSSGEYAALSRPFHIMGMELGISIASAALRGEATGTCSSFVGDVASAAKKDLKPGDILDGEGGYTVRGRLMQAEESVSHGYLPIGLSRDAKVTRPVAKDAMVTYEDVLLDESQFSYRLRKEMEEEFKKR